MTTTPPPPPNPYASCRGAAIHELTSQLLSELERIEGRLEACRAISDRIGELYGDNGNDDALGLHPLPIDVGIETAKKSTRAAAKESRRFLRTHVEGLKDPDVALLEWAEDFAADPVGIAAELDRLRPHRTA